MKYLIIILSILICQEVLADKDVNKEKVSKVLLEALERYPSYSSLTNRISNEQERLGTRKDALWAMYNRYLLGDVKYNDEAVTLSYLLYIETLNPRFLYEIYSHGGGGLASEIVVLFSDSEIVRELDLVNVDIQCIKRSMNSGGGISFHWALLAPLFEYRQKDKDSYNFLNNYKEYLDVSVRMMYGDDVPESEVLLVNELKRKYDVFSAAQDKVESGVEITEEDRALVIKELLIAPSK